MLSPLASRYGDRAAVSLYHTPDLTGFKKFVLPPRWDETVGLQHMKVYLFDDTLILSGANLSQDYFDQRQDRYVVFRGAGDLADYFARLVACVSDHSYRLAPTSAEGSLELPAGVPDPAKESSAFRTKAGDALNALLEREYAYVTRCALDYLAKILFLVRVRVRISLKSAGTTTRG